jgi:hypothetical protein
MIVSLAVGIPDKFDTYLYVGFTLQLCPSDGSGSNERDAPMQNDLVCKMALIDSRLYCLGYIIFKKDFKFSLHALHSISTFSNSFPFPTASAQERTVIHSLYPQIDDKTHFS